MYRKLLLIGLFSLIFSGLAFANGQQEEGAQNAEPLWFFNAYAHAGFPVEREDNPVLNHMIEQSGVDLRLEPVSFEDFETKLQLYAASSEMPDFWNFSDDIALNTVKWKEQGLTRPVGDSIDEYAPRLKDYIPRDAFDAVTIDGGIWAIPAGFNPDDPAGGPHTSGFSLRKDWLDKLGRDIPETLDELHDILYAFTYEDPDGNGENDTIGMGENKYLVSVNMIANAYGVHPDHWYDINGKLVRGDQTDRFIEALTVAREWYAEGIIDPEFPALTGKDIDTKLINSQIGSYYGHVWHPHPRWKVMPPMRELTPEAELILIPAVEGPYGDRGYAPGNTLKDTVWVSSQTEREEEIFKLIAWLAEGTNHLTPRFGIEGKDWKWNDEHNGFVMLSEVVKGDMNGKVKYGLGNGGRVWPVFDRTPWRPEIEPNFAAVETYMLENKFIGAVPAMSEYSDIDTLLQEAQMIYILGNSEEKDIITAQAKWAAEGGDEITEQVNDMYSRR